MPEWTLGHRLWRSRRLTGETQAELAARLGIGLKTIKEAEADKRIPKRAVILGWAVATGVDPDWLDQGRVGRFPPAVRTRRCPHPGAFELYGVGASHTSLARQGSA